MEGLPSGVCLQGPAPNRPRAALAEDRCRGHRGKAGSMWSVRYESRRRVQANHRSGVDTDCMTSKPGATSIPGMSPSGGLVTGWAVSGIEMARARLVNESGLFNDSEASP
jgi:hypothetical protein